MTNAAGQGVYRFENACLATVVWANQKVNRRQRDPNIFESLEVLNPQRSNHNSLDRSEANGPVTLEALCIRMMINHLEFDFYSCRGKSAGENSTYVPYS